MAYIDVAGFVADLKEHAVDHGFHVHDERHFVETYSLRQTWEVDLHPEEACDGPIDLHLALDVDPRVAAVVRGRGGQLEEPEDTPPDDFQFPLIFQWTLPPLPDPPDLLVLATELAGVGGVELPIEVSAIDSFPSVTDAPERSLQIVAKVEVSLSQVYTRRGARAALRHPRPLPHRQPLPARAGAGLARRGVDRPTIQEAGDMKVQRAARDPAGLPARPRSRAGHRVPGRQPGRPGRGRPVRASGAVLTWQDADDGRRRRAGLARRRRGRRPRGLHRRHRARGPRPRARPRRARPRRTTTATGMQPARWTSATA